MKSHSPIPHQQFCALARKYAVTIPDSWSLGVHTVADHHESWSVQSGENVFIPLFPWRCERRFIELRRIVESKTLEDVVLCRFSCVGDGRTLNLRQIVYREFDLLEWITGVPIVSVFGCSNGERFSNILARLENGTIASVEAGVSLPESAEMLDRHELVARRGVASDRVVDTHVPQQSVYLFDKEGLRTWTDTDAELFGLPTDEIAAVRAAFELAKEPASIETNISQHKHLLDLLDQTFPS